MKNKLELLASVSRMCSSGVSYYVVVLVFSWLINQLMNQVSNVYRTAHLSLKSYHFFSVGSKVWATPLSRVVDEIYRMFHN